MISLETFYKEVKEDFGEMRKTVGDLHSCVKNLEKKLDTHLEVGQALQKQKDISSIQKERKFYIVIALIGVVFGLSRIFL